MGCQQSRSLRLADETFAEMNLRQWLSVFPSFIPELNRLRHFDFYLHIISWRVLAGTELLLLLVLLLFCELRVVSADRSPRKSVIQRYRGGQ